MKTIQKILIANRGEIAVRIIRTCRELGISTVAVFSDADKNAVFVKQADEAFLLPGVQAADTYLNQDRVIEIAKQSGADAIHPGYGFLAENASFSKKCEDNGIIFIGPKAEVIEAMGSKVNAKQLAKEAGVPTIPGFEGKQDAKVFKKEAQKIDYPVLLKASAGGGGKGMRIVNSEKELEKAFESAKNEAEKSFGDGKLLLEKYFPSSKHIEIQIFGDEHGNYMHLFERECSVQRRYQKIIEESPSPSVDSKLRKKMGDAAVSLAENIKYTNAGTVEFILDEKKNFYFLEVNTRLQVEHPVTEEVTGLDLVKLQIEIAKGQRIRQNALNAKQCGHAMECRIYAEDPENSFFPSTGTLDFYREAFIDGTRHDSGVETGSKIDVHYDPMISKVVTKGENRNEAIHKMIYTLQHSAFLGLKNNKDFLIEILQHENFLDGSFSTKFVEQHFSDWKKEFSAQEQAQAMIATTLLHWTQRESKVPVTKSLNGWRNSFYQHQFEEFALGDENISVKYRYKQESQFEFVIDEETYDVEIIESEENTLTCTINHHRLKFYIAESEKEIFVLNPQAGTLVLNKVPRFLEPGELAKEGGYIAPMPGEILKVLVKSGDKVKSGDALLVMNSMKMENTIEAHSDGEVEEVLVDEKAFVEADALLLKMK